MGKINKASSVACTEARDLQGDENILSPIVKDGGVTQERRIDVSELRLAYKRSFDLDIDYLLPEGIEYITQYRCNQSGYRFYSPACIVGDSAFYDKLQEKDWYYESDKWEFREALKHIRKEGRVSVLEIGCARGDFLNMVHNYNVQASLTGLELNEKAAAEGRRRGFHVLTQSSEDHSRTQKADYEVVAGFQVLEHIPSPSMMDFLWGVSSMIKPGGKFIVSVPDNSYRASDSIFVNIEQALNMPPHHQGLWDIPSLAYLTKILPLRLDIIAVEPATAIHRSNSYRGIIKGDLIKRFGSLLGFAIYSVARPFYNHALKHLSKYLPGHTVLAVYSKLASESSRFS